MLYQPFCFYVLFINYPTLYRKKGGETSVTEENPFNIKGKLMKIREIGIVFAFGFVL